MSALLQIPDGVSAPDSWDDSERIRVARQAVGAIPAQQAELQRLPVPEPSTLSMPSQLPSLNAPAPNVVQQPTPTPQSLMQESVLRNQNDLKRLQTEGNTYTRIAHPIDPATGLPSTQSPSLLRRLGGIAGAIGDAAFSSILPGAASITPGTTLNRFAQMRQDQNHINSGLQNEQTQALADYTQQRPEIEQSKIDQRQLVGQNKVAEALRAAGKIPMFDEHGMLLDAPDDHTSQAFLDNQATAAMHNSTAEKNKLMDEIKKNGYIPGTPEYAQWREKMDSVNKRNQLAAGALAARFQGLSLRANDQRANFYGMGPDDQPLPNAPQFQDDEGNVTVGGLKGAKTAITQQGSAVGYRDLGGSIAHAQQAIQALHASGADLSDPLIVAAMSDPHSTIGKVVNGKLVKGNLSDTQVKAIGALNQLREQAGLLRAATKGTASEGATERVLETIPTAGDNAATANNKFAEMQGVYNRLTPGVVTIGGGLSVGGKGGRHISAQGGTPSGATHIVPGPDGKNHYTNAAGTVDLGIAP